MNKPLHLTYLTLAIVILTLAATLVVVIPTLLL